MPNIVKLILQGVDNATAAFKLPIKSLDDLSKVADKLKGPLIAVAGASVAAFGALAYKQIEAADASGKLAQKIGVTVGDLGGLEHAAELSSASADTLRTGFKTLADQVTKAAGGNEEAQSTFQQLGISVTEVGGSSRNAYAVMKDLSDVFARTEDGATKTAVASKLLGRSGLDLIPMLNGGSGALADMKAEADALGLTFTDDTAAAAEVFNDSLSRLKGTAIGAINTFVAEFLPTLANLAEETYQWVKQSGVMQGIAFTLIDIVKGLAVAFRSVYDAVASGLTVIAALATMLGFALYNQVEAVTKSVAAFARALGTSSVDALELVKSLGDLAGIMGKMVKGDFAGAWDQFSLMVDDVDIRIHKIGASMKGAFVESGKAMLGAVKQDVNDAASIFDELGNKLQKRWEDFGKFTYRVFMPDKIEPPTPKTTGKGKITLFDQAEINKQIEMFKRAQEEAIRQRDLMNQMYAEGKRGSEALLSAENLRYQKQLEQIDKAGFGEDEYYAAREVAAQNHELNLSEIHRQGLAARADLDQIQRQGDLDAYVQWQASQQAADQTDLQARQRFIDTLHDMWQNSFFAKMSTVWMNFATGAAQSLSQGFGGALANLATGAATLKQAVDSLWKGMVGGMANYFGQLALNTLLYAVFSKSVGAATAAATLAMIAPIASAWSVAATGASIATFGAAAGSAALVPFAMASNAAFAKGLALAGGSAHSGMINVPETGTYVLKRGEMVSTPEQSQAIWEKLEGSSARLVHVQVNLDGRTLFKAMADASRDGRLTISAGAIT